MKEFKKTVYVLYNPLTEQYLRNGGTTKLIYEADWWNDEETAKQHGQNLSTFQVRKMKVDIELIS